MECLEYKNKSSQYRLNLYIKLNKCACLSIILAVLELTVFIIFIWHANISRDELKNLVDIVIPCIIFFHSVAALSCYSQAYHVKRYKPDYLNPAIHT